MHQACEIIAKLVDDKKIGGRDAIILMHAVLNNNLQTNDWFSSSRNWWNDIKYTTNVSDYTTSVSTDALSSTLATTNS